MLSLQQIAFPGVASLSFAFSLSLHSARHLHLLFHIPRPFIPFLLSALVSGKDITLSLTPLQSGRTGDEVLSLSYQNHVSSRDVHVG